MSMSAKILALTMGLLAVQAFTPLPIVTMPAARSKGAVTCLQMSSAPRNNLDRRSALYLASALAAGLVLPTNAFADDLPIAVIGPADGNIGGEIVAAFVNQNVKVRSVCRAPTLLSIEAAPGLLSQVIGDVTKPSTLPQAVRGCRAVIFAASASVKPEAPPGMGVTSDVAMEEEEPEAIDYIGLANVAKECIKYKVPRLIVLSAASCTDSDDQICTAKTAGEQAVRDLYAAAANPSITYTIARPGRLIGNSRRGPAEIELNQGDDKNGFISRGDMADIVAAVALSKDAARETTFEAFYRSSANPRNFVASLEKCTASGKSMKECFFGDAYAGNRKVDLNEMLTQQTVHVGEAFKSGREIGGTSFQELFTNLKKDKDEPLDIFQLGFTQG